MTLTTQDISVVIPAYNCADTILEALAQVFRQSALPGEVIVVDDGSTDDTRKMLEESAYRDRILFITGPNGGPSAARNKGIRLASKAWIAFLDADDLWTDADKLADQIAIVNQQPAATLIDAYAEIVWQHQRSTTANLRKQGHVFDEFLTRNAVNATSTVLASRAAIIEAGLFCEDIRFGEDRILWAQLAKIGEVHTLPKVVCKKINHAGNLTSFSERNYAYRLRCVDILLEMGEVKPSQQGRIWFKNQEEFFRAAMYTDNVQQYLRILADAKKHIGHRILLSRFFYLAAYARLFNSFRPLVSVPQS